MTELAHRLANLSPAQRALLEKRLAKPKPTADPVAIIGMSCRFPGARNLHEYWRLIRDGIDATGEIPADRWDRDAFYDATGAEPGKMATKWGAFLDDIDQFDPQFFGITPREAARMDPQQRLLLEVAWEALEHAGRPADQMAGTATGVFVGIGGSDYSKILSQSPDYFTSIDAHMGTGNALSIAANRVSYIFDFHGPSAAVDTACSSASLAVHLAVESLRRGECDAALAGGVNAILTPETTIAFSKAQMLSPDGRCRPFDAAANGYVRGEGCGLVLLKRLDWAERDGDQIFGTIRATAVNQDGRTSGISAPNGESQKACIRAALAQAGLTTADISYIEAHGTGTPLGDPIEMQALVDLFRRERADDLPVRVTSVKANIGHTETVSGVSGLIKLALLMRHGLITPQLHLQELNPHINLTGSRVELPTSAVAWPPEGRKWYAGVSSFGFGGANTHIIVEAPSHTPAKLSSTPGTNGQETVPGAASAERPLNLLKLTARSATAIQVQAENLLRTLESEHPNLGDTCFTLNTGRSDLNHRAVIIAATTEQLCSRLRTVAAGGESPGVLRGQAKGLASPKSAMLFTGQGSQYAGMGRQLYETEAVFRQEIDRCDEVLADTLGESLLDVIYPDGRRDPSRIDQTLYTQPALFALEWAAASLWMSWGVRPSVLIGHSIGEFVAATVAGVMNVEDGLALVTQRARLMQQVTRPGKMAVIFATEAVVGEAIKGRESQLSIAAVNGPENTVISGDADEVDHIVTQFEARGTSVQRLSVSHAFHSPHMDDVLDDFEQFAEELQYQRPNIPIASNLTGSLLTEAPTARYWRDHLRGAVRFTDGLASVAKLRPKLLIECGPTASLLGMTKRILPDFEASFLPTLRRGQEDWAVLAASVAEYFASGGRFDWRTWEGQQKRHRLLLPTYPFERVRCWYENVSSAPSRMTVAPNAAHHPLLGARAPVVGAKAFFESVLRDRSPAYLADHQVQGSTVAPAAAFFEQVLSAGAATLGADRVSLEGLSIQQALFLSDEPRRVQTTATPESNGASTVEVYSAPLYPDDDRLDWTLHAIGDVRREPEGASLPEPIDLEGCRGRTVDSKSRDEFYQLLAARGLVYGPAFRMLGRVDRSPFDAVAEVDLTPPIAAEVDQYLLHPVLGDACLQTFASTAPLEEDGSYTPHTYMPVHVERVRVLERVTLDQPVYCYAIRRSEHDRPSPDSFSGDAYVVRHDGHVLVAIEGIRVQRVGGAKVGGPNAPTDWLYQVAWHNAPIEHGADPVFAGKWVLFADSVGVADRIAEEIEGRGGSCVFVRPGASFEFSVEQRDEGATRTHVLLDPGDLKQFEKLFDLVAADPSSPPAGIAHFWSLDISSDDSVRFESSRSLGVGTALGLMRALARRPWAPPSGVWFITCGAQMTGHEEDGAEDFRGVAQSPLVGFVRSAQMEQPDLSPRLIDIEPGADAEGAAISLLQELSNPGGENQIAFRAGERVVARLVHDQRMADLLEGGGPRRALPTTGAFQLRIASPGSFDSLQYAPVERRSPEAGQVEVEIKATGLNFSDVLKALGLYPGIKEEIVPLGIEASGVVTAVGDDVNRFHVGDEVMGVMPYAFGSHTTTAEYALVAKPHALPHEDACTIPITFLTAHYALIRLAQLQPGERVLIHAGAGGVGLAAIQIAQRIGAEVFSTAGSEEKRELLRSLGVRHLMNSRTLDFAEEVLAATDREGVDVVLNSLPSEAINRSLSILRAYGRFLEIGKTDIYQNRMIGLEPFQDNLSYFAIDLDRMLRQRPDYIRGLFSEVMEQFESEAYKPLRYTAFPARDTVDAFRYMSQRKNIGKVVVSFDKPESRESTESDRGLVRADGAYLITGGLGALGQRVAHWLAAQGAGAIFLVSRRPPSPEVVEDLDRIRKHGARVECLQADAANADSLRLALAQASVDMPLRGVVHAAGVLADGVIADMTHEQLEKALRPKVDAAWNVHEATLDCPLDFFIMFSSVAAVLGAPGQANYAAGNAMLDALAHARRRRGLPATSINWGPWADSGMATEERRNEGIQSRGIELLRPEAALNLLGDIAQSEVSQITVVDARWNAMATFLAGRKPPLLTELLQSVDANPLAPNSQVDSELRKRLLASEPEARAAELTTVVQAELAKVVGVEMDQLDTEQPLSAFGLDSLMALELKNNLEGKLAIMLPMAKLLESPSIRSLATSAADILAGPEPDTQAAQTWSPLVSLRAGTSDEPLFLLPAIGGDIQCYKGLVSVLHTDQPLLVFRPRGLDDAAPPHDQMQSMVNDYIDAIVARQPSGAYHLAGWSTGGLSAFAIAEELERRGSKLGVVALFDAPLPSVYQEIDIDDDARFFGGMLQFISRFSGKHIQVDRLTDLAPEERFAAALAVAKHEGLFSSDVNEDYLHRLMAVGVGLITACRAYNPSPIRTPVLYFSPSVEGGLMEIAGARQPEHLTWRDEIGQQLKTYEVTGDHFSMMTGRGAEEIAEQLSRRLQEDA